MKRSNLNCSFYWPGEEEGKGVGHLKAARQLIKDIISRPLTGKDRGGF